jgi:hypothetical protein
MTVSLDGYIVGPDGSINWAAPDEEVFNLATHEVRNAGVHLPGRRLYETMLYWETADHNPSLDFSTSEFAAIWKALPKVVFSTTLAAVQGNARLASGDLAEEIERWRHRGGPNGRRSAATRSPRPHLLDTTRLTPLHTQEHHWEMARGMAATH